MTTKLIHGAPTPLWKQLGLQESPPEPCQFHIGDCVIFTNEYGLKFDMDVIGFAEDTSFQGRFIHTIRHGTDGSGSAWWFPHRPEELALLTPSLASAVPKDPNHSHNLGAGSR